MLLGRGQNYMFIQTLFTGIAIGGIYSLMAVGYCLIFSVLNFSNFAYGSIIMLGAYIGVFSMNKFGFPFWLVLLIAMVGAGVLNILSERIAYRPLRKREASSLFFMISAMGTNMVLENLVYAVVGANFYTFPPIFQGGIEILGVDVGYLDIFAIIFSFISIYLLNIFINYTRTGRAIRAVSYDSVASQINGVNLNKVVGLVFIISGMLAGLSGMFLGVKYMVYPNMGWITNKAYIAAVIGGLGSLPGAVVGGLILGILESMVSVYGSSVIRDVFSFSFLIIMLLFMPSGLLGQYREEKL